MAGSKSHQKSACSPLLIPRPQSNSVPANGLSRSAMSAVLPARSVRLDDLDLPNSSCASDALWLPSAARLLASATFSSGRRWRASALDLAFAAKRISPVTPSATNASANTDPHSAMNDFSVGYVAAKTTSMISPNTTAAPPRWARASFLETSSRNLSSLSSAMLVFPCSRNQVGSKAAARMCITATACLTPDCNLANSNSGFSKLLP